MTINTPKTFEQLLDDLNDHIQIKLKAGELRYDRGRVLDPDYAEVKDELLEKTSESTGRKILKIVSLEKIRKDYKKKRDEKPEEARVIHGTCREVTQEFAISLVEDGFVDEAEVRGCLYENEAHYVIIGKINDEEIFIDVGYTQPIQKAIPVNGIPVKDSSYPKDGKGQMYGGNVEYKAWKDGEDIYVTITEEGADKPVRTFKTTKLTKELDLKIAARWLQVTGKTYATGFDKKGKYIKESVKDMQKYKNRQDILANAEVMMKLHEWVKEVGLENLVMEYKED